ncbi:galanin receptor type 1-like [Oculina patagonica]
MTSNNSTIQGGADHFVEAAEFRIDKITLYVLIFTLSCIGNSLVAIVIIGARGMRTTPNLLILNLALCDLVTPVLSIPFDLAQEELHNMWPFGKARCKVLWPFQTMFSTSSSLTLAAISLDRFRALVKPLVERVSTTRILMSLLAIHVFSICLCIPYFIALEYNDSEKSCDERWSSMGYRQTYTIALFLFQFALPLTTMSVAYLLIYRSLRSNILKLFSTNSIKQRTRAISKTSNLSKDSGELKLRREQNIHLAKMFVIVVVVFAISMSPNQIFWLWMDFGHGEDNKFHHYISVVCRLFTYANSVLNPFIYALKSKEFRSGFARIGRQSMQPLRKISNETRRFVRKISGNPAQSGQQPITDHPGLFSPNSNGSTGRERHELDIINCFNGVESQDNKLENVNIDVSFLETLLRPGSNKLFEELRESDC